jgi:RHS repeat-associated protein
VPDKKKHINVYPFGLKHKGYNNVVSSNGNSVAQKFGFGGKELSEELGLNTMDFGVRNYDAALGRWMNLDPMTDQREWLSPYQYAQNSPILRIDPDGALDIFYSNNDGSIERGEQEGAHEFYVQTSVGDKGTFAEDYTLAGTLTENADGLVQFPDSGSNFGRYGTNDAGGTSTKPKESVGAGDRSVTPETAAALFGLASALGVDGLSIDLGDMSSSNGSDPWQPGFVHHSGHGHNGNRSGIDVDFRYLNTSGNSFQSGNAFNSSSFSTKNNQNVYDTATTFGFTSNYQGTSGSLTGPASAGGHNDHGHIGRGNNNTNVTTISRTRPPKPTPVSSSLRGIKF